MNSRKMVGELLRERLKRGEWNTGERMPSLATLGQELGVSRITVWRALSLLRTEKLVHANRGGAIIAGPRNIATTTQKSAGRLWERLAVQIGRDVVSGTFDSCVMLPAGKLAQHYGVNVRTLHKALDALVKEGLLIVNGRTYGRNPGSIHAQRRTIMLISYGEKNRGLATWGDPRTQAVVESLERECQRLDVVARCEGFHSVDPTCLIKLSAIIQNTQGIAGFIVNIWTPWDQTYLRRWHDLITYLVKRDVPVVVIDQARNFPLGDLGVRNPNLRMLRIAGVRAGEAMAEILQGRGHKNVAYITPSFDPDWVQDRYNGLRRYYERYTANSESVQLFALNEYRHISELHLAMFNLPAQKIRALYRDQVSPDELRDIIATWERIRRADIVQKFPQDLATRTVREIALMLARLGGREHDKLTYSVFFERLLHHTGEAAVRVYLEPFFEGVLARGDCTAWVCSDEKTARAALAFLNKKKVRVPEKVALATFENWREEFELQLTVYDFNMHGMVQEALHLILDERELKRRPVISEIEGYVVERKTTRR